MITDEMLRAAAARSCDIYVAHLEKGFDPENQHVFSEKFERKIKRLKRKADYPIFYRTMRCVASIILAILITGGAWITVDTEARAAFWGWVHEVYETYFIFHYGESVNAVASADYRPMWIPEDYTEFKVSTSKERTMVAYTDKSGKILRFNYIHKPDETDWFVDVSQANITTTSVNGNEAKIFIAENPEEANAIAWVTNGTAFYITGFVNESILLDMAESVKVIS